MAKEISLAYTASLNLYAVLRTAVGTYINGTTPEAFNSANWTSYAVAFTEYTSATGQYWATFPAVAAGYYYVEVYNRVGGSAALTDGPPIAVGDYQWDGTRIVPLGSVLPAAAAAASGGLPTVDGSNGVKVSVGTGTGQVNVASGKVPATLASTDVTGNVAADLQTIKTQTVTCAGGVTVPAATLASTANITAGTITTTTNLTNAPTVGDFTSTMKTSLNAATPASVVGAVGSVTGAVGSIATGGIAAASFASGAIDATAFAQAAADKAWSTTTRQLTASQTFALTGNITGNLSGSVGSVSGAVGSVTGAVGSVTGAVGSVTGNVGGNVTGSVGSISGVTFPSNFSVLAIAASTGQVGLDWSNIKAPTTTVALTGTTISTGQVVASVTGAVGSVTGAVGSVTGAVGSVTGSVGSISGVTFPAHFATLSITPGGSISEVILVDNLTTYTGNTLQTGDVFDLIGTTGSHLTSLAPASTALSTAQWTNTRAAYLDNIATAQATPASVATAVWTTTTASDFTTVGSPGYAFSTFGGSILQGTVAGSSPTPSTTRFKVTLASAISSSEVAATFVGLWVTFVGATNVNQPAAQQIETAVINSTTSLTLTFSTAWSSTPVSGDLVTIST